MSGPVVLLTGASRGIGLAVLVSLLESFDARVVTISRSLPKDLKDLSDKYGENRLIVLQGDITDPSVSTNAVQTAITKFSSLDSVILNAGSLTLGKVSDTSVSVDEWKSCFDINFFSLLHTLHAAIPELKKREGNGRVIFVSSGAAIKGVQGWGPYSATKAAMNSLTRTLATEEPDIISIALRPGTVDTDMQGQIRAQGGSSMAADVHKSFVNLKLTPPHVPGHVIASLAVSGEKKLSGGFHSYDADELKHHRKE